MAVLSNMLSTSHTYVTSLETVFPFGISVTTLARTVPGGDGW